MHVDKALIIVCKPEFLLSVPGRSTEHADCVLSRLEQQYPDTLLVHRLDLDTSGLMVFARSKPVQRDLSMQFQQRQVRKQYIAVVEGEVPETYGCIALPLNKDWPNRPRQKVDFQSGKHAITYYRNLGLWGDGQSRLLLRPITGRTHQLRIHLRMAGHAILGCDLYGTENAYNMSPRLLLHASNLVFTHPERRERVEFSSAAPF